MVFISSLGGVGRLLLKLSGWIIGGYASFHSALMTISALYKVKKSGKSPFQPNENNEKNIYDFEMPLSTRLFLYILQTPLKHVLTCLITDKHKFLLEVIAQGNKKTNKDFDIKNLILQNRLLRHKLEFVKELKGLSGDPDFNKTSERELISLSKQ